MVHVWWSILFLACGSRPPGVERISPLGGPPGTPVTITGNGFEQGITAELGGRALGDLRVDGTRLITGTVPLGLGLGEHDLVLTNPGGATAHIPRAFAISPASAQ